MTDRPIPDLLAGPQSRRDAIRSLAAAAATVGLTPGRPGLRGPARETGAHLAAVRREGRHAVVELEIARTRLRLDGRSADAITINGTVPGPLIRLREGDEATIRVHNRLDEDTSIHWHGILLPPEMDGVPGLSFRGIRPGETFEYRFPVRQAGTYWYHSHSGLQEQLGHYGALVIDPATAPAARADREHAIVLSDWTFEDPYRLLSRLKKQADYYNQQRRTLADLLRDFATDGFMPTMRDRLMWSAMRMNPTDIADVTGATYSYLLNGAVEEEPWSALFASGERVRLRLINASAASYFDFRIPGLPLQVVEVSGQPVEPVETDEIRIAIAETYDVIVEPADRAYAIVAEAMDRSGMAAGVLAPRPGMTTELPRRRPRPLLTMTDMGMDDAAMGHGGMMGGHLMGGRPASVGAVDHAAMGHTPPAAEPGTLPAEGPHGPGDHGVGNAMAPTTVKSRLDEPGLGLGEDGRRVLRYTQLRAPVARTPFDPPTREIELHLTGNMDRFVWGIDGVPFDRARPIEIAFGERIRLTMVNDTMMNHPMHLHGMWMELENGQRERIPRVHTVNVKPAEKVSLLVTADAPGRWAFHCHVLYHMEVGMFREVRVSAGPAIHLHHSGADPNAD